MSQLHLTTSEEETVAYACSFAGILQRGDVVALYGELGSGKTQFVKGVCKAWKTSTPATSPSFVILNRYAGRDRQLHELLVYHFDLYRITSMAELYDLGYEEFLRGDGICVIEWAERLGDLLPRKRYDVHFSLGANESERHITIGEVTGE